MALRGELNPYAMETICAAWKREFSDVRNCPLESKAQRIDRSTDGSSPCNEKVPNKDQCDRIEIDDRVGMRGIGKSVVSAILDKGTRRLRTGGPLVRLALYFGFATRVAVARGK